MSTNQLHRKIRQYRSILITLDETSKQEFSALLHVFKIDINFKWLIVFSNSLISKTLKMGKMTIEKRGRTVEMFI